MYKNILNPDQLELLPFIQQFANDYYLVGGTAIALQIGHRKSIDFDLFRRSTINREQIQKNIKEGGYNLQVIFEDGDQLHGIINNVRLSFYEYPYPIRPEIRLDDGILMPSLLSLGAMKAFALGKRAKWKDYVDLYFIMKQYFSIREIADNTRKIFGEEFNEKAFRSQLAYFKDIDYTEKVIYLKDHKIGDQDIKKALIEFSLAE